MLKIYFKAMLTFCIAFSTSFIASSILAPISSSTAADVTVRTDITHTAYSLTLGVSQNVTLDVNPSPTGVMSVDTAAVTTSTTSPSGYKLYLNMNSTSNDLIHTSDDNLRISPVSGTFDDASALDTDGTWGYAIANDALTLEEDNDFDESYEVGSSFAPNSNKFAAVPTSSNPPQLIASTAEANTTTDELEVFYGIRASYDTEIGTYTNQVQYTAIADNGASHGLYISPEQTPAIDGGDTLTVTTTLYSTAATINSNVYLLTATELANVHNDTPISTYNNKKLTCSRDTTAPTLTLSCTSIAAPIGNYFIYVDVPDYGESYEKEFNYIANFYNITTMQQMTADICNDTRYVTTPSRLVMNGTNVDGDSGTTTYPGSANLRTSTYYPQYPGDSTKVPETTLVDTRDSYFGSSSSTPEHVGYTVRKLADGNCWMTENLALNFLDGTTFTSADTNVTTSVVATNGAGGLSATTQTLDGTVPTASDQEAIDWAGASVDTWLSRSTNKLTDDASVKLGTYYNWYTATMGSIPSGAVGDYPKTASMDICPAGWRLSNYEFDGSWLDLFRDSYHFIQGGQTEDTSATGIGATLRSFPFSFSFSGGISANSGARYNMNTDSYQWMNVTTSNTDAPFAAIGANVLYTRYVWNVNKNKNLGYSVRCVAKRS